jgi:hypothetical protein
MFFFSLLFFSGMGMALDQGIDHFLVLAAVFVMCLFR